MGVTFVAGRKFETALEQKAFLTKEFTDAWRTMAKVEALVMMNHPEPYIDAAIAKATDVFPMLAFDGDLRKRFVLEIDNKALLESNNKLKHLHDGYHKHWLTDAGFDASTIDYAENKVCNAKGQCVKLTKALARCVPKDYGRDHEIFQIAQEIAGSKARPARSDYVTAISVAFRGTVEFFLSINPADFITSTYGGGFTSCHRPGGEYFGGNLGLITTKHCIMGYVGSPERKTGRMWMYYLPDVQQIYQLKTYGTLPEHWRDYIRHALQDVICPETVWVRSTKRPIRTVNAVSGSNAAYVDKEKLNVCYQEARGFDADAVIPLGDFICPSCGSKGGPSSTDAKRRGGCASCKPVYFCAGCETPHVDSDKLTKTNEGHFCQSCFIERYIKCYACNAPVDKTKAIITERGRPYCKSCAAESMLACGVCGVRVHSDDAMYLEGTDICNTCYERAGISQAV